MRRLSLALLAAVLALPASASASGVIAPFPSARGVALDSAGRIIAVGRANNDFAVVRYESDGSLDPAFGDGGVVLTHFGSLGFDGARAVEIDRSNRVVVAGDGFGSPTARGFMVARYLPDGSLDRTFGRGG